MRRWVCTGIPRVLSGWHPSHLEALARCLLFPAVSLPRGVWWAFEKLTAE